jgi:hypothetical protein
LPSVKGELTRRQILDTFIYMDIDLRTEVLDYFFMRMFALSNNADRFPYARIFDVFQPELPRESQCIAFVHIVESNTVKGKKRLKAAPA